jgi:hypothetical protein
VVGGAVVGGAEEVVALAPASRLPLTAAAGNWVTIRAAAAATAAAANPTCQLRRRV